MTVNKPWYLKKAFFIKKIILHTASRSFATSLADSMISTLQNCLHRDKKVLRLQRQVTQGEKRDFLTQNRTVIEKEGKRSNEY